MRSLPWQKTSPGLRAAARPQSAPWLGRALAGGGLWLVVVVLLTGCEPPRRTTPVNNTAVEDTHQEFFESGIEMLFNLEQYDSDQALTQIVARLNESKLIAESTTDWKKDPLLNILPAALKKRPFVADLPEFLASTTFDSDYDGEFLQQCAWTSQVTQNVIAEETDPLRMATLLFDWTIRNIQIEPNAKKDIKNYVLQMHQPWEVMLFGRGTATQRAWLFTLLLRQANLEAVLLDLKDDNEPHVVGLLHEHELYLYDTLWGIPLALPSTAAAQPPASAKAVNSPARTSAIMDFRKPYTLGELAENPALLRQFDAGAAHKYPYQPRDFEQVKVLIEGSPGFLSRRMQSVQRRLAHPGSERAASAESDDHKMVLSVSISEIAAAASKIKHVASARLWTRPLEVASEHVRITNLDEDAKDAETKRAQSLREANAAESRKFFSGGPLRQARLLQFRNIVDAENPSKLHPGKVIEARNQQGAKAWYMLARPGDSQIEKLAQQLPQVRSGQMTPDEVIRYAADTRQDATYWLGVITLEQGEYRSAVDFFLDRTLEVNPNGPWTAGARYNLAQAYEALGEPDNAVKYYQADRSPQQSGNLLRALWLKNPPAAVETVAKQSADEAKPPRFEDEIVKFEQQDRQHPVAPGGVLFVGSSSIRKWDLKKSFPDLDALNRGFGGSEISDSVRYAGRIVTPYKPRLIVFYAGDNDIAAKKTPETVRDDFLAFVKIVRQELPRTPLVFISIKPSVKRWALIDTIRQANVLIEAEIAKLEHVKYLDVHPPMLDADGQPKPELFVADGLHLSDAGYKIWTERLQADIKASPPTTP